MARIVYLGTAPGQAGCIAIGGNKFRRGEVYEMSTTDIKRLRLLERGGFELEVPPPDVKPKPAKVPERVADPSTTSKANKKGR